MLEGYWNTRNRIRLYLLVVLPAIIVFSCLPGFHPENYVDTHYKIPGDRWVHFGCYFIVAMFGFLLLSFKKRLVYVSFLVLFLVSFLIEIVQKFIPGRGFSWMDIISNGAGIALAYGIAIIYYYRKAKMR